MLAEDDRSIAGIPWVHIDLMAWNQTSRPGQPEGAEAIGMRASDATIGERFLEREIAAPRRFTNK